MLLPPKIIDVSNDTDYINFVWEYPTQSFFGYYLFRYRGEDKELIAQIDKEMTSYRYTVYPEDRGAKIVLGLCVYHDEADELSQPAIIDVCTYPDIPCNLRIIDASENRVELAWDNPSRGQFTCSWAAIAPNIRIPVREAMIFPNIIASELARTTTNVTLVGSLPTFDIKKNNVSLSKDIPTNYNVDFFVPRNHVFSIGANFILHLAFGLRKNNKTIAIMRLKEDRSVEFVDVASREPIDRSFVAGDEFSISPVFDLEMMDLQDNKQFLGSLEIQQNGSVSWLNRSTLSPLSEYFFSGISFSIDLISGNIPAVSMLLDFILVNPNIRCYQVERSEDGLNYSILNLVTERKYIDAGNDHVAPRNGRYYYYRVSTLSWNNVASFPASIRASVVRKTVTDVRTLLQNKIANLPTGNYRIKAVGARQETGETPWINIKTAFYGTDGPEPLAIPIFNIRAVGVNGERSLPIRNKSIQIPFQSLPITTNSDSFLTNDADDILDSDGGEFQDEVPRFRIRAVSVDGLESHAMLSQTLNLFTIKYIVNKTEEFVRDDTDHKMVNKKGGL